MVDEYKILKEDYESIVNKLEKKMTYVFSDNDPLIVENQFKIEYVEKLNNFKATKNVVFS